MYDLKRCNGTFKGLIGECLFKITRDKAILVRFFSSNKFATIFNKVLEKAQVDFLLENWYSLDAIEYMGDQKKFILYEIKTRNHYRKELGFKPKMTKSTRDLYSQARQLGFVVKCATVWLYENWEFNAQIEEYDEKMFYIDKEKQYDRLATFSGKK